MEIQGRLYSMNSGNIRGLYSINRGNIKDERVLQEQGPFYEVFFLIYLNVK